MSSKKIDIAIQAIHILKYQYGCQDVLLTIIGEGSERSNLEKLCKELKVEGNVFFKGYLRDRALAEELSKHMIQFIPAENEGFGLVALEGMGCGIIPIASKRGGGLMEAIGDAGIILDENRAKNYAEAYATFDKHKEQISFYRQKAKNHLCSFQKENICADYFLEFVSLKKERSSN